MTNHRRVSGSARFAAALLVLALAQTLAAQSAPKAKLADRIQSVMDRPEFKHAMFGIEIWSLDDKKPVYALNADKLFVSASTTKLVTTGAALELLGADYRFHTRIYRTGEISKDGTLDGDLVLVAVGDPNLSGRIGSDGTLAFENEDHAYDGSPDTRAVPGDPLLVIRELAKQVASRGVKRVNGRVIVDASLFKEGDRELGSAVVMSPIMVNDNLVDVMVAPGASVGAPAALSPRPVTSYVRIINKVTTAPADSNPSVSYVDDTADVNGLHTVTATGTVPVGKPAVLFGYRVPVPHRFAEVVLQEALMDAGVKVTAPAKRAPTKPAAKNYTADRVVAEHTSPPLSEEAKVTLKVSQNLHASVWPLTLAATLAPGDTSKTGFDLIHDWLQKAQLDLGGAVQSDGAGGAALFSPDFMAHYLAYMATRPSYGAFHAGLPILGRDGTLWNIQPNAPAAGQVHAKTGTFGMEDALNRRGLLTAKGLAGYVTSADGRHLAFAIYVNNVSIPNDPDAATRIAGQALGEIAAAAYDAQP